MTPLTLAALAGAAVGYAAGRTRPAMLLTAWAQGELARPDLRPTVLIAYPVVAVALGLLWLLHPRRTAANLRSWQAAEASDDETPDNTAYAASRYAP
ncbi:hypothetical protein ACH4Q7_22490 [Streptomyces roseolus]|uniref:hypothetical protein n=1 Tax=Streptomyces roseolus TaxID=67358 RepID=UPI00379014E2